MNSRNSATAARICGKSWISSSDSSPSRRARKRKREKAYAASALQKTCTKVTTVQTMSVLRNQRAKGRDGLLNSAAKLSRLMRVGIREVDTTLPSGFSAADSR